MESKRPDADFLGVAGNKVRKREQKPGTERNGAWAQEDGVLIQLLHGNVWEWTADC